MPASSKLILLPSDHAALKRLGREGEKILKLGERYDALPAALSFIRNRRSSASFRQFLLADRQLDALLFKRERFCSPL
jgi:hypothetical protein